MNSKTHYRALVNYDTLILNKKYDRDIISMITNLNQLCKMQEKLDAIQVFENEIKRLKSEKVLLLRKINF